MKKYTSYFKQLLKLSLFLNFILSFTSCKKNEIPAEPISNIKLDELSDFDIYSKILSKISENESYYIETEGITNANFGLISYKQETKTTVYNNNQYTYNFIKSSSTLINHEHRLLLKDKNVCFYDSQNKFYENLSVNEYLKIYGKIPTNENFYNYPINEELIISSSRSFTNLNYKIILNINPIVVSDGLAKQMQKFGDLAEEPVFKSITLTIVFDEDFNVSSFTNYEEYEIVKNIPVFGKAKMKCVQELNSIVKFNHAFDENLLSEFS